MCLIDTIFLCVNEWQTPYLKSLNKWRHRLSQANSQIYSTLICYKKIQHCIRKLQLSWALQTGDHEHTLLEQHLTNTHLMTKQIWNSPDELVRFVIKWYTNMLSIQKYERNSLKILWYSNCINRKRCLPLFKDTIININNANTRMAVGFFRFQRCVWMYRHWSIIWFFRRLAMVIFP